MATSAPDGSPLWQPDSHLNNALSIFFCGFVTNGVMLSLIECVRREAYSHIWLPRRPGSDTVMKLFLHSLWCILLSAVVVVVVRVVVVVGGVWLMRVKVEVDVDGLGRDFVRRKFCYKI